MSQEKLPVTVIVTVLNEATTLPALLTALQSQTYTPTEVIITDGGSSDATLEVLHAAEVTVLTKKGNRSVGRNAAIAAAQTELIAITDAGCVPQDDWLESLVQCYLKTKRQVIAGYYVGVAHTPFEEAVIPYALVMPDRVVPDAFLPATRSMLLQKQVWHELGGFDTALSDNEDYAFAHALQRAGYEMGFCGDAIVRWQPRSTLPAFWSMIYRFARGDVRAGILRTRVLLVFARYFALLMLASVLFVRNSVAHVVLTLTVLLAVYCLWAVAKNKKYVQRGWYWLPILQITADLAVMAGSLAGVRQRALANQRTK